MIPLVASNLLHGQGRNPPWAWQSKRNKEAPALPWFNTVLKVYSLKIQGLIHQAASALKCFSPGNPYTMCSAPKNIFSCENDVSIKRNVKTDHKNSVFHKIRPIEEVQKFAQKFQQNFVPKVNVLKKCFTKS